MTKSTLITGETQHNNLFFSDYCLSIKITTTPGAQRQLAPRALFQNIPSTQKTLRRGSVHDRQTKTYEVNCSQTAESSLSQSGRVQ